MDNTSRPETEIETDGFFMNLIRNAWNMTATMMNTVVTFTTNMIRRVISIGRKWIGYEDSSIVRRVEVANTLPFKLMAKIVGNDFVALETGCFVTLTDGSLPVENEMYTIDLELKTKYMDQYWTGNLTADLSSLNASDILCQLVGENGEMLTVCLHLHIVRLPDFCLFTVISVYSPLTVENKSSYDLSYQQFVNGDDKPKVIHHKQGSEPILMANNTTVMKMRIDDKQNWKSGWLPVSLTGEMYVPFSRDGIPHPLRVKCVEAKQHLGEGAKRITITITDDDISHKDHIRIKNADSLEHNATIPS